MKLSILDEELSICTIEGLDDLAPVYDKELRAAVPEGERPEDMVFFYMAERDWIVINKSHALYEVYLNLMISYLGLSTEARKDIGVYAPTEGTRKALRILNDIIIRREMIYNAGLPASRREMMIFQDKA